MSEEKIVVVAPYGAFKNHIRWLMLLDDRFCFRMLATKEPKYKQIAGADWPAWNDVQGQDLNLLGKIGKEIQSIFTYLDFTTIDKKINFILEKVYPENRTWHNWLIYEWLYREFLDDTSIFVNHEYEDIDHYDRSLICTCDTFLAWKCYLKFNTSFNLITKDYFWNTSNEYNKNLNQFKNNPNVKIIDSTCLFNATLDKDFYYNLTSWFKLSYNYEQAQIIHQAWYNGHKRAEKEIIKDLTELYRD